MQPAVVLMRHHAHLQQDISDHGATFRLHHKLRGAHARRVDAARGAERAPRVCSSYLWPASLPNELAVRSGLEALTQGGSGLFCPSVFTSGSISDGEGVSLAPAMPAERAPPEEPQSGSRAPHLTAGARGRRGGVSLPKSLRGDERLVSCAWTLPPSLVEL